MSTKERRLKLVEVLATRLAKEREEELPRVSGKTRQQAIFDAIEMVKSGSPSRISRTRRVKTVTSKSVS